MMLGILLANERHLGRVLRYTRAAHSLGHEVQIFVTFDAVKTLALPVWEEITSLSRVFACTQTVHAHQIKASANITLGSQFDHAEIANSSDRFLSFT